MLADDFICVRCGLQYLNRMTAPDMCTNCDEERESISHQKREWTSLAQLQTRHTNVFSALGDGVTSLQTAPIFAIGQEAYIIQGSDGNVLWDCISCINESTVNMITSLGGLVAIAISHPHFLGSAVMWSRTFNSIPIFIHAANRPWLPMVDPVMELWEDKEAHVTSDIVLRHCGGHFPGSSVLYWRRGASGNGALFTSDTIVPVEDRQWVSFMYSYPNLIPISAGAVRKIIAAVEDLAFDRLYGGPMYGSAGARPIIYTEAKAAVLRSAERYINHLED